MSIKKSYRVWERSLSLCLESTCAHNAPVSPLAFVHTCAWEGSAGLSPAAPSLKHTAQSGADGWHMCPESPSRPPPPTLRLHHDTRIHTPLPPSAAIDSCAFNKSAEIQLLARSCAEKPRQLSRTGNCLSPCQGGNWIAGLRGGKCTHIVPLCTWLCCELLADCIMASWKHMWAPLGTVWTKKTFLLEVFFCELSWRFSSPGSAGRFAATGAMSKTYFWQVFLQRSEHRRVEIIPISFLLPFLAQRLVLRQAEVVQLRLLSLFYH